MPNSTLVLPSKSTNLQDKRDFLRLLIEKERRAVASQVDFADWLKETTPGWTWDWPYQQYIQRALQRVTDGTCKKLILSMPPRHGKTEMTTVRYPVFRLTQNPSLRVIVGAYNQGLANKFSRKAKRIAERVLNISGSRAAVEDWETVQDGGFRAIGVGGGITGQGGDLIIVDDPVKNREEANSETYRENVWEWFTDDLYTRLEPGGAIIIIMTRWHEDDLVGRILASEDAPNWTVINLPAEAEYNDPLFRALGEPLCPARYDKVALADRKLVLGSYAYAALFQGRPAPAEGGIIKRDWIRRWAITGLPANFDKVIQSWDMAFKDSKKSSYVVGQVWGKRGADCYLLDQVRARLDFTATQAAVRRLSDKWPQTLTKLIEDKANGPAIINSLRREVPGLIAVQVEGSKEARLSSVSPLFESGNVFIPDCHWTDDYANELCSFPNAANDDQVDATSQALECLMSKPAQWVPTALSGAREEY
jgi:predicted phage terminase large subunit-like protein